MKLRNTFMNRHELVRRERSENGKWTNLRASYQIFDSWWRGHR